MKVSCPSCRSTLSIDDKKIPASGARVKCPSCQGIFPVMPGSAVPLPGAAGRAPERVGLAPPTTPVPLPGTANPPAAGRPRLASAAVPLPGGAAAPAALRSAHSPGPTSEAPRSSPSGLWGSNVPLPGASLGDELDPAGFETSSPSQSVPLPGAALVEQPTTRSPSGLRSMTIPLPGEALVPPMDEAKGRSEAPEIDLSSVPESIAPPPSQAFDFDVPPAGEGGPAPDSEGGPLGSFDFGQPGGEPTHSDNFDFSPPPSEPQEPAATSFDFAAPQEVPEPPSAPMSFGEIDLSGGGRDLELDPTKGEAPAFDELETDLGQPMPAPASSAAEPADGLEMLSFIDDTAKDAGVRPLEPSGVRRFHVKRRSGKVFGPFEEAVIIKMLEDGQLLGNEEVSLDAETWQPVGSEAAFQPVIARLMEGPSHSPPAPAPVADDTPRGPSMERLKQLYEGRMAAVAVVQSKEPVPFKKRLPFIAAGALIVALLGAGVSFGLTTPYGYFGLKLLFPAKVRSDTREAAYLNTARKGLLSDTWQGLTSARDSANQALAIKEFPEARAVWSQAVFSLKRKYGKASEEDLARAREELPNIKLLGAKHQEVLKSLASEALTRNAPDEALGIIGDALVRQSDDLECNFLRAEAYLQKKQPGQAKGEYEQILKKSPQSARAHHALGLLHKAQNELDLAAAQFSQAIDADGSHLASSIELAEIEILARHNIAKGAALLDTVLAEKAKATLSPSETAQALALEAETLVTQGKLTDAVTLFEAALKADASNTFTQARLGRLSLELNDLAKAVALLKKATATAPENFEYAESFLSALIAAGRMDEAQKAVQSATSRFPGNAKLAYLSGRVADALDNPKEAESSYRRAIAADPKNPDAYLALSRLYMRFRRFSEAKPELEAGLEQAPGNASLRVGMGELAFHERDLDRAETELRAAVELDPASAEAYLGLSRVSLERGKLELAAEQVGRALQIKPHIPGGELQRGLSLWRLGRLDEAVAALEAAQKIDPSNLELQVTRGGVEVDRGDFKKARMVLAAALAVEPGHPDGNFYLARVELAERHDTQAIEAMKRALDVNPKSPLYHYWMGRIFKEAHKGEDALAEWKRALELDATYTDALEALGQAYFARNESRKALQSYQKALASDPKRHSVQVAIGDVQMKLDDWDGAIASYTKALQSNPKLTSVYNQLGLAWEEKHQVKKAIESYSRAVEVDPEAADAWRRLGWLYKSRGKKSEAALAFKRYLDLKPQAEDKKQLDDEIYYLTQ